MDTTLKPLSILVDSLFKQEIFFEKAKKKRNAISAHVQTIFHTLRILPMERCVNVQQMLTEHRVGSEK